MRFLITLIALSVPLAAQSQVDFDVASIKRNTAPLMEGVSGTMRTLVKITARSLVLRAYAATEVAGLPSWGDSERYDAAVKFKPEARADDVRVMWQRLLADRMKLSAHYEPREVRGYKLVLARSDGKLGPELKPSALDCPPLDPTRPPTRPPQAVSDAMRPGTLITPDTERLLMSQCRSWINAGNTTYAGAVDISGLVMALRFGGIREAIEDATGLEGLYSFKLTFSRETLGPRSADDAPSIFTAVQEQLGLKLEPITIQSQAVIIDHIERPTEN